MKTHLHARLDGQQGLPHTVAQGLCSAAHALAQIGWAIYAHDSQGQRPHYNDPT